MIIGITGPCTPEILFGESWLNKPKGHPSSFTANLAKYYLAHGHSVRIFTMSGSSEPFSYCEGPISIEMVPARSRVAALDLYSKEVSSLAKAIKNSDCDVIHAHWVYEYALGAQKAGKPYLVTMHDDPWDIARFDKSIFRVLKLCMGIKAIRKSQNLTVPSPYLASRAERYGADPVLVPNGVPSSYFSTSRDAPTGCRLLAIANGLTRWKNIDRLLSAFEAVRKNLPDCTLTIAGHGFEPDGPAMRLASSLGAADGLNLVGPQGEGAIKLLIDQHDLLVHPSLTESFGLVLVEAMARGLPVVAGRFSGAVPWVLEGCGELVDVTRSDEIALGIERTLRSPDYWRSLSTRGLERAQQFFVAEDNYAKYLGLLERRKRLV